MKVAKAQERIRIQREGRRARVRKKIRGTADRPRLAVHRSNRYISVQLIDDSASRTIVAASTRDKELSFEGSGTTLAAAAALGQRIAALAKEHGIEKVVFDKGWYRYHGRVRALAEAAREAGLVF
ncbi:MAG: 50S ribosomal protein L18 [Candidatus Dadabacteria bacterium]|nr:MAG: 50S ribosomal protein L18 [Candidatus Dadabacteria bacterium]